MWLSLIQKISFQFKFNSGFFFSPLSIPSSNYADLFNFLPHIKKTLFKMNLDISLCFTFIHFLMNSYVEKTVS